MTQRTWDITLDGTPHHIEINHLRWKIKHEIHVDGVLVTRDSDISSNGRIHTIRIGDKPANIQVVFGSWSYRDLLWLDDEPVFAAQDKPTDKFLQNAIAEHRYWLELAKLTGLHYLPIARAHGDLQHRLVGTIDGYLTLVQFGLRERTYQPFLCIVIRYSTVLDTEGFTRQLTKDAAFVQLFPKVARKDVSIGPADFGAPLSYRLKSEPPQVLADRIFANVNLLSKYALPPQLEYCESTTCTDKSRQPLFLIFAGGFPLVYCNECIAELPKRVQQDLQAYNEMPSGLGKGILAGFAMAILGALAWTVVLILFSAIAPVLSATIFVGVLKGMDYVRTKRTLISLTVAGVLSLLGITLGLLLFSFGGLIGRFSPDRLTPDLILNYIQLAWDGLASTPRLWSTSLSFSFIIIVPYLVLLWLQQRSRVKQVLSPKIENVGVKWF